MTRNLNILNDLLHGRLCISFSWKLYICFFFIWFMKPFFLLWIRLEDTLIELYLAGNNQRPSYETACGVDNQDYQMLSANGLCLG